MYIYILTTKQILIYIYICIQTYHFLRYIYIYKCKYIENTYVYTVKSW
jgi:hypothetical protein